MPSRLPLGSAQVAETGKKRTKSAKISFFRWQIFDHLITVMTNLHWFLWCWWCCPFASSVIWEDRLDALSVRRATIADVTSTNWTKKEIFGEITRFLIIVIATLIPVNSRSVDRLLFLVDIVSPCILPSVRIYIYCYCFSFLVCQPLSSLQVYISPSTEYIHVCASPLGKSSNTSQLGSLCSYPENSWRKIAFLPFHTET